MFRDGQGWPGLGEEVSSICNHLHLTDASRVYVEKDMVKQSIRYDHNRNLPLELKGKKLRERATSNILSRREYTGWSLAECSMACRLETKMFICRANMPSLYNRDLTCRNCTPGADIGVQGPVEDQHHLEWCPGFSSQWAGLG